MLELPYLATSSLNKARRSAKIWKKVFLWLLVMGKVSIEQDWWIKNNWYRRRGACRILGLKNLPGDATLLTNPTPWLKVDALNRVIGLNTHLDDSHIDMDRLNFVLFRIYNHVTQVPSGLHLWGKIAFKNWRWNSNLHTFAMLKNKTSIAHPIW